MPHKTGVKTKGKWTATARIVFLFLLCFALLTIAVLSMLFKDVGIPGCIDSLLSSGILLLMLKKSKFLYVFWSALGLLSAACVIGIVLRLTILLEIIEIAVLAVLLPIVVLLIIQYMKNENAGGDAPEQSS